MALTFDQTYRQLQVIGKEVGILVKRGDVLAMDLYRHYCNWFQHEGVYFERWVIRGCRGPAPPQHVRLRNSVVAALEAYLQRDLTVHERDELAGKKGHLVEDDPAVPSNIIDFSVTRAIRRGH
jgi:hypothetical protein